MVSRDAESSERSVSCLALRSEDSASRLTKSLEEMLQTGLAAVNSV